MRRFAYGAALVALVAVLAPVVTDRDSFPLSNYPMFASDRGREASIASAVGRGPDEGRHRLSPRLIGGSYEVVHAAATVARAVRAGEAAALCAEIAERTSAGALGRSGRVVAIEVVTERHDTVAFFEGDEEPRSVAVHARCPVGVP